TNNQPIFQILTPTFIQHFEAGQPMADLWDWAPFLLGTGERIEVWDDHRPDMLLSNKYDCERENELFVVVSQVPSSESLINAYRVKISSYWVEQHPSPLTEAAYFSFRFPIIKSNPPWSITTPTNVWAADPVSGLFHLEWTSDPSIFGTAVRFEL